MPKLKKVFLLQSGSCAFYDPNNHTIYYDKYLDGFPRLKKELIAHEMKHAARGNSFHWHAWIDLKDYVKQTFMKDYYDYAYHIQKKVYSHFSPKNAWDVVGVLLYTLVTAIISLLLFPFQIVMEFYYNRKRTKK